MLNSRSRHKSICITNIFGVAWFFENTSQTCRAWFNHARDLRRIKTCLSLNLVKQIVVALVSSKLNYCKSLFHNMPEKVMVRLQRVQNCLARVGTKAPRFTCSFHILKRLHWLPVKFRIHFKICTITFWALNDNHPACVTDFVISRNALNIHAPHIQIDWLFSV